MSQESSKAQDKDSLLALWVNTAAEFWQRFAEAEATKDAGPGKPLATLLDSWQSAFPVSQSVLESLSSAESPLGAFQDVAFWPEIVQNLTSHWWSGFFDLQRHWLERVSKVHGEPQPFHFERRDRDFFKNWLAAYEQSWQPFLQLPQLGLTRVYQEKASRLTDKFHLFQIALADFLYLLYLPMENSLLAMQEHLAEHVKQGQISEDFQVYYKQWIKTLEGQYMTLFTEPDFLHTLKKGLAAMHDFLAARQEVLTATLKNLAIPTHEELDELYQELYLVKKRVRKLTHSQARKKTTKCSPSSK
jgi:class III poly(R)-hydroxyalkanoic acid synthase PhaE subunit